MSKVEPININEVLTKSAKEAGDTATFHKGEAASFAERQKAAEENCIFQRGREQAFNDLIKFFNNNKLMVTREVPDEKKPEGPTPEEILKEEKKPADPEPAKK